MGLNPLSALQHHYWDLTVFSWIGVALIALVGMLSFKQWTPFKWDKSLSLKSVCNLDPDGAIEHQWLGTFQILTIPDDSDQSLQSYNTQIDRDGKPKREWCPVLLWWYWHSTLPETGIRGVQGLLRQGLQFWASWAIMKIDAV